MPRSSIVFLWLCFLTACSNKQDLLDIINPRYVGQKIDVFFSENGPPKSQYKMDSGEKIYSWSTGEAHFRTPDYITGQTVNTPTGSYGSATNWGGDDLVYACDLDIYTDAHNRIERFRIARNRMSKCNLYFGRLPEKHIESAK